MKKFTVISVLSILLSIPIFAGVYVENLVGREFGLFEVLSLILGFTMLLLIGMIINSYGFNSKNFKLIKSHEVINY